MAPCHSSSAVLRLPFTSFSHSSSRSPLPSPCASSLVVAPRRQSPSPKSPALVRSLVRCFERRSGDESCTLHAARCTLYVARREHWRKDASAAFTRSFTWFKKRTFAFSPFLSRFHSCFVHRFLPHSSLPFICSSFIFSFPLLDVSFPRSRFSCSFPLLVSPCFLITPSCGRAHRRTRLRPHKRASLVNEREWAHLRSFAHSLARVQLVPIAAAAVPFLALAWFLRWAVSGHFIRFPVSSFPFRFLLIFCSFTSTLR